MGDTDPLFDIETPAPFQKAQRVVAHTIWGNEPGRITSEPADGAVEVRIDRGGLVLVMSTSRLTHEENVR